MGSDVSFQNLGNRVSHKKVIACGRRDRGESWTGDGQEGKKDFGQD